MSYTHYGLLDRRTGKWILTYGGTDSAEALAEACAEADAHELTEHLSVVLIDGWGKILSDEDLRPAKDAA